MMNLFYTALANSKILNFGQSLIKYLSNNYVYLV